VSKPYEGLLRPVADPHERCHPVRIDPGRPRRVQARKCSTRRAFGGVKQSCLGREDPTCGLDEFREVKYICL
jgi:hypothetical protein